jgi:predicted DNA-binding transcriptional regulator YafY
MRRADRLFQIVQYLRGGRLLTARILAERLEVSDRTIYRDIADLQASGVPIDGEAGVGYLMRDGYDLPPLMFNREEVAALVVGARIVGAWGGPRMALAAQEALQKIDAVLPAQERNRAAEVQIYAFDAQVDRTGKDYLDRINSAISGRRMLAINYVDVNGDETRRDVEPLGLFYWGKVWTLVGWCRLRSDFRMFRVDRIGMLRTLDAEFSSDPGRTLQDFLADIARGGSNARPTGSY